MDIGIWGLGRMGFNMVRRLEDKGDHRVIAGNRSSGKVDEAVEHGAATASRTPDSRTCACMADAGPGSRGGHFGLVPDASHINAAVATSVHRNTGTYNRPRHRSGVPR